MSPGDAVANLARSVIAGLARAVVPGFPGNSNTAACELIGPDARTSSVGVVSTKVAEPELLRLRASGRRELVLDRSNSRRRAREIGRASHDLGARHLAAEGHDARIDVGIDDDDLELRIPLELLFDRA